MCDLLLPPLFACCPTGSWDHMSQSPVMSSSLSGRAYHGLSPLLFLIPVFSCLSAMSLSYMMSMMRLRQFSDWVRMRVITDWFVITTLESKCRFVSHSNMPLLYPLCSLYIKAETAAKFMSFVERTLTLIIQEFFLSFIFFLTFLMMP